jgi:NDP-sugar pyrophosphorylase family protein
MASKFRPIVAEEISKLTEQGCSCDDWSGVQVAEGFDAGKVKTTHFSGQVKLGVFDKQVSFPGGVMRPAGISNATIHNCTIGNNVYINQVKNHIANYIIEDDVIIENVDLLAVEGQSSFGNGTEAEAVNEAGGREIPIFDGLSAHTAYVIAFYRHRPKAIENLQKMVADYAVSVTSSIGLIAKDAKLTNCRIIKNVKIGPAGVIEGINKLENGSINSNPEDPVYIGPGVFAEDFIACSGSKITDGAIISRCFVGQGTILARQYSAENSVFFANCEGFHGEACAIFAGPYTVTHHKSTLLIAGMFSFFNAGSGTNQSNHMYKLGPVHQGVTERGCKTASDSYILWPVKIGAFSVVVGKHYGRADTSDFPFSYLIENGGESILVPGTNVRKSGFIRDAKKWPKRDRRKSPQKLDLINFEPLSPYTIQKALKGCQLLAEHKAGNNKNSDCFFCPGAKIKASAVDTGIKLYQMCIDKFLGDCLIKRLENKRFETIDEVRAALQAEADTATGKWVDLAGLLAPEEAVQKLLGDIEDGTIKTLEQVTEAFQSMYDNRDAYEWSWAANLIQQRSRKATNEITAEGTIELVTKWKKAVEKFGRFHLADAQKEYTAVVQTGFGIDGDEETRAADFEAVRGTFETNSFVSEIKESVSQNTRRADKLIGRLEKLR